MTTLLTRITQDMTTNNTKVLTTILSNDKITLFEISEILNNKEFTIDILKETKYTIEVRITKLDNTSPVSKDIGIDLTELLPAEDVALDEVNSSQEEVETTPVEEEVEVESFTGEDEVVVESTPRKRTRKKVEEEGDNV